MADLKIDDLIARLGDGNENDAADPFTNPELTTVYIAVKRAFRDLIKRAERVSRGSGGIPSTGNRMFWASVLFTRLTVMAKSVWALLPDPKPREHWDFSSVASLVRNLAEAQLVYYWLCQDEILDEVRAGRFILLYLHDYGSRKRLFPHQFDDDDPIYADLVRQFGANPWLASFEPAQRKVALKGERTPFIQDEVLDRMGQDRDQFRLLYRFFSQHTHTGPLSFYRMNDHDRGSGVETRHEKRYMIMAIGLASETLQRAIEGHLVIFPDAETREPFLTDREVISNVERAQGRARRSEKSR
jgi:hypothetical protein